MCELPMTYWAGEVRNVSLLVAIGVNGEGYREFLGICDGTKEDKAGWSGFLKHLKGRGLHGVHIRRTLDRHKQINFAAR
jgi:putative transposase